MSDTYTHSFPLLGETVTVESNSLGNRLTVTFGNVVIDDGWGECIAWPYMGHLRGAARRAAEQRILREAAEASIRSYIEFAAEELARLTAEVAEHNNYVSTLENRADRLERDRVM